MHTCRRQMHRSDYESKPRMAARKRRRDDGLKRPMISRMLFGLFVGGSRRMELNPTLQARDLCRRQGLAFLRHPLRRIESGHALQQKARLGVAQNNGRTAFTTLNCQLGRIKAQTSCLLQNSMTSAERVASIGLI